MIKESIVEQTRKHVEQTLSGESSGHDWWHTYRVWRNAIYIGQREEADLFVVQLAALLHDIADYKFHAGDEAIGPRMATEWLYSLKVEPQVVQQVHDIILRIPFRGNAGDRLPLSLEGMVVQDADWLDAIGAIGIARVFAYGGHKGREIYDPNIKPRHFETFDQYKNNTSPSVNHFYEKLLLLKDLMNTKTARAIALKRDQFMSEFLNEFFAEWDMTT